jgi:hypothetical protein
LELNLLQQRRRQRLASTQLEVFLELGMKATFSQLAEQVSRGFGPPQQTATLLEQVEEMVLDREMGRSQQLTLRG